MDDTRVHACQVFAEKSHPSGGLFACAYYDRCKFWTVLYPIHALMESGESCMGGNSVTDGSFDFLH